jgi:DNA-binding NarL/FixJ family response regulator
MTQPADQTLVLRDLAEVFYLLAIVAEASTRGERDVSAELRELASSLRACAARVGRRTADGSFRRESRPALTARERSIAVGLAAGRSYKEIATELDMSVSSVQSRVKSIYLKLGVHSKTELRAAFGAATS